MTSYVSSGGTLNLTHSLSENVVDNIVVFGGGVVASH